MPCPRIAVLSKVVFTPGSPEASPGVGKGSPSVCSTSYLGIPQLGHGNGAVVAEGDACMARIDVLVATRFEQNCRVCSKTLARSGKPEASVNPAALIKSNPVRRSVPPV
jgi:hypothetical protein